MDDIELTKKIKNLQWVVDLEAGTVESELIHYRIVKKSDYVDLKSTWISSDLPTVMSVISEIQRKALAAFRKAQGL